MSPNKTLYVRDEDEDVWQRAEAAAHTAHQSVSQYITGLIRRHVPAAPTDGEFQRIIVDVGGGDADPILPVGFMGRWLVEPEPDETRGGPDAGAYWGVALTKRGNIAVYVAHVNDGWPARLDDYSNLDAAAEHGVPEEILAKAAKELGQERVIWRDI